MELSKVQQMPRLYSMTEEQVALVKSMICKDASDDQLALFINQCERTGLDPFSRQIHAVFRRTRVGNDYQMVMTIQTGIDGFRLIAERTGEYRGQTDRMWLDHDGNWKDHWMPVTKDEEGKPIKLICDKCECALLRKGRYPFAAKVGVLRKGFDSPTFGVAHWDEYKQTTTWNNEVKLASMWQTMPAGQLMKCAEALALRAAFPQELSGIYSNEEMEQASNSDDVIEDITQPNAKPIVERKRIYGSP